MRVAKLFAYLAICLLLPLWLYNLSDNELNEAKKKQESAEATKNEKLIAVILANKQGQTETNFNSNHLDSLFYLIAKSNQKIIQDNRVTFSPNHNNFPIYDFSEKGPFKFWEIKLRREQISEKEKCFLVFNNISQSDTACMYGIFPAENRNTISTFYLPNDTTIIIYPQDQFVVQYDLRESMNRLYYVKGIFIGKDKKGMKRKTMFNISLIIGRDD